MVYAPAALALLAPLLIALGASSTAPASAELMLRKCRNTTQKTPVYFIDGVVSTEAALTQLTDKGKSAQDVFVFAEVTCLNPADSTLMDLASATLGLPALIVWTKSGPYRHLEPTLKAVRDAQVAHFARAGTYSSDLAALRLMAPPDIKVELKANATGWGATASVDRKFSPRCRMFGGDMNGVAGCN